MIKFFDIQIKEHNIINSGLYFLLKILLILLLSFFCFESRALGSREHQSLSFRWVIFYENENKIREMIDPSCEETVLACGTLLTFLIEKQEPGTYVYLLHFASSGSFKTLFPPVFTGDAFKQAYNSGKWQLINEGAEDYFYILAATERFLDLENNIRKWQKTKDKEIRTGILETITNTVEGFIKTDRFLKINSEKIYHFGGTIRSDFPAVKVSGCTRYAKKIRIKH